MGTQQVDKLHIFSLSPDKQQLLLNPAYLTKETNADQVVQLIKKSDYVSFKIDLNKIQEAIHTYQNEMTNEPQSEAQTSFVIADKMDAQLTITLSEDKLIARAEVIAAFAGQNIDANQLLLALKANNICFGIIKPAIMLLIKKSQQAPPGLALQITIAKGIAAQEGQDTDFHALIDTPQTTIADLFKGPYGSINFQEVESLVAVNPGTKLLRKIPFIKGLQGKTVTGEIIPFTAGIDSPFCINAHTKIADDDDNLLVATAHGLPNFMTNGVIIEPILVLDSVAPGSPEIIYDGCLIIKGDVAAGSKITTTGDLTVIGFIESSTVKCGGDLYVSKGIIGEQIDNIWQEHTTSIECEGAIYTNFVQFAKITAQSDLHITSQLIHSSVYCQGFINVKDATGKKGTIYGGFLCAHKGINTVTLGAVAGIHTTIDLIGSYHHLLEQKKEILSSISHLKDKITNAVAALEKIDGLDETEQTISLHKRLVLTINDAKTQIEGNHLKLTMLLSRIQKYFNNTQVIASKVIYNDVSISIAGEILRTKHQYGATTVHIKNAQLVAETYHH